MRRMIKTRGCKRCGGDLAWERDKYGDYVSCIQCGAEDKVLSQCAPTYREVRYVEKAGRDTMLDELVAVGSR